MAAHESDARPANRATPWRRAWSLIVAGLLHLRDWAPLIFDAIGVLALLMGMYMMLQKTHQRLDMYDEGIVLSHSRMVAWGYWPFRDFFSQYPPGLFFLMVALWKVFGTQIMVARYLSEVFRLGVALLAGVAGGQTVGRRFAALPAGVLLMFLARLTPSPAAWYAGLMFALASVIALSHAAKTRARGPWIVAGVMLGLTLSFRHDLFVYFLAAMSPGVFFWVRHRAMTRDQVLRLVGWTAVGLAIPFSIFWLPCLVVAKWSTILHDGFLDNVRYIMPGRKLPLPALLSPLPGQTLPMCLVDWPCMIFLILLVAPALGLIQTVRARSPRVDPVNAGLLTALSLAVIPQATGRADFIHAIYGLAPGLILAFSYTMSFGRHLTWRGALAGVVLIGFCAYASRVAYPPSGPLFTQVGDWQLDGSPFALGVPDDQAGARRELRAYVQSHTAPNEEIFIGSMTHAKIMVNEVDLYFILDRPAAVRYLQFDPGTVTREEVQAQMIRTLDAKRTHMVILASPPYANEPNASAKMGSTLLDTYIRSRYKLATTIGSYEVRFRDGN